MIVHFSLHTMAVNAANTPKTTPGKLAMINRQSFLGFNQP
jgi:hypothetical protein